MSAPSVGFVALIVAPVPYSVIPGTLAVRCFVMVYVPEAKTIESPDLR